MATAKRTGLVLIVLALAGLAVSMTLPASRTEPTGTKSYAIAISGHSGLRLIAPGAPRPADTTSSSDRQLYCRFVARAAGLELGARCTSEATTFADASQ